MSVLRFFQRRSPAPAPAPEASGSASAARDRLKVLVSHERAAIAQSQLVEVLRDEILGVIAKHVHAALLLNSVPNKLFFSLGMVISKASPLRRRTASR